LQATLFPLIVCGLNFLINFVAISYASSRAIPFVTMVCIGNATILEYAALQFSPLGYQPPFASLAVYACEHGRDVRLATRQLKISAIGIFIVLPLTLAGTLVGRATFGQPDWPCRVNPVPRQIPEHHWYLDPLAMSLMGGLLPFFSIFIEVCAPLMLPS
jgi:transmembrane 9 superfamily protein 3